MTMHITIPRDAEEFLILLPSATFAIERWANTKTARRDQHGVFYDAVLRSDVMAPTSKIHYVLRPATLKLGAQSVLSESTYLWRGWEPNLRRIWTAVASGMQFGSSGLEREDLDLIVQYAWFREVWFA
jgi:hypothetical protein